MGRKSTKENKNLYQLTREDLKLSREAAAELLESVTPERIEKIENERSLPHPDEVLVMSDKYKQPSLCNYYCANQCPIGQEYVPEVKTRDHFQNEIDAFVNCVKTREKLASHIDTVIITAKIMQAIYDSSDAHREIAL